VTGQAPAALTARRDRADEYAIADVVSGNSFAELFDHTHWFVSDHETGSNWILASDDMKVGATNRRQRYAYNGFAYTGAWFLYLFNSNFVLAMENICFHVALLAVQ
jgi:hypothetical protein